MSDGKAKSDTPKERKPRFTTLSGLPLERLYTSESLEQWDPEQALGFPGEFPYTRGIYPSMYRGRFWTMRQYAGFGSAVESNKRYRYLLSKGQMGLSVAFDLPTQIGMDSDHPLALGEVGKVGVAIDSLEDMEALFDQIPLDKVSTSMTINATAAILLCLYVAVAKKQGASLAKISGTIQNDILKEYIARGTYIYPVRPAMRIVTDIFAWCRATLPKWNTISISGYHIREAGSTAVQEVAFTLADGIAYVQAALDAGLQIDEFAPQLSFFFNAHSDLLEEIAKYRAARRLWAKIMRERFQAKDPRSLLLRFHAQTAGSSLTAQQPENNIVRVAIQALAAVLGGCQSLHTNSMDEALALPTEESALIALRTQQIIANETGVANTIDPVAGSYAFESLTGEIESRAQEYLSKIDAMGGMIKAIESGFVQTEIQRAAYEYQRGVETKENIVVGVNDFVTDGHHQIPTLRIDAEIERAQVARLQALRAKRDTPKAKAALAELQRCARTSENLLPVILAAVEAYATVGEISDAMRQVYGEYQESVVI
ncbi:MAG TPA: methylmalonyl-CoA mutase family protein [Candidatus Acidoferrales bacterium]|nr:methylmalonyl-CoA mutase family protein [Candidatus Acidoferrales bacterium]HXR32415.1 methylmalonyl-CoA mutase family protein [Verrucomicrobiae bacterium]